MLHVGVCLTRGTVIYMVVSACKRLLAMADSLDSGDSREGAGPPLRRRWVVGEDVIELFFKLDFALSVV